MEKRGRGFLRTSVNVGKFGPPTQMSTDPDFIFACQLVVVFYIRRGKKDDAFLIHIVAAERVAGLQKLQPDTRSRFTRIQSDLGLTESSVSSSILIKINNSLLVCIHTHLLVSLNVL